ncbi:ABC transporter ATP-binding protein [Halopenitus persicus]|uniref:Cobalamin import ATP-binding protein BtuD n=1 Tax=Halopenitus persicus TaxID=1048396 RepID=A0A1H3HNY3_9EURY|nr:ABC transporter ATP-binding protein [Halopenitus persicus]SDY17197.1 iron complex transport system ATP-binding protein [Halopenitus persicus]
MDGNTQRALVSEALPASISEALRAVVPESLRTSRSATADHGHDDRNRDGHARADRRTGGDGAGELAGTELVVGYPGAETPVIAGETVEIEPGSVTALIGPNGSGKSTLLKTLANQLDAEAGSVLVDGRDVHSLDPKELARKLGLLSQESTSPNGLTVEDLVYHGRYPHRGFFETVTTADQAAVNRAMELAGVTHLRTRELGSLSGGQRQLAWIAMVLAQETDILLLDEPTTFLDPHHQLEVMEIVETLHDESDVTVVLVLHDIEQAARYADHVIALRDGEVRARGPPAEVVTEDLLANVFRIEATVEAGTNGPTVTMEGPLHDDPS